MSKIEQVPPLLAYTTAGTTASVPFWIDSFTTYGEVALLALSIIIAAATAIIQVRKAFKK